MLVANPPGQTPSYALHSKKTCHATNNSNSSGVAANTTNSSTINNNSNLSNRHIVVKNCGGTTTNTTNSNNTTTTATTITKVLPAKLALLCADKGDGIAKLQNNIAGNKHHMNSAVTTTTAIAANSLMKTLSVRLNRGTELLKETVQKALISKIPTHLSSVLNLNLYTVPPTATHRFPAAERLNASSADSLQKEMCHFMPIRTAPTTPCKSNSKSRGASIKMPKACIAKKDNAKYSDGVSDSRTLTTDEHLQFRPKPNSTLLTTIFTTPERRSAFVCLIAKMKSLNSSSSSSNNSNNAQSKKQRGAALTAVATNDNGSAEERKLHKTKTIRGRTKSKVTNSRIRKTAAIKIPMRERKSRKRRNAEEAPPPVQSKKLRITTTQQRITRSGSNAVIAVDKRNRKLTAAKAKITLVKPKPCIIQIRHTTINKKKRKNNTSSNNSISSGAISTSDNNSRRNNNFAANMVSSSDECKLQRSTRKRKSAASTVAAVSAANADADTEAFRPTLRKSARLSKEYSADVSVAVSTAAATSITCTSVGALSTIGRTVQRRSRRVQQQIRADSPHFSPPLTRSRLKHIFEQNLTAAAPLKARR